MKQIFVGLAACAIVGLSAARPSAQSAQSAPPTGAAQPAPGSPDATPGLTSPAHGQIIQRILVKVNGEIFTQRDLEEMQIQALQDKNRQVMNPADLQNDAALRAMLVELTPKILVVAIDDLIIVQRAHELGYKVTEAQYKDAIDGLKKDNKMDDATFLKALEQQGMTMQQLREQIEHTALIQMVRSQEIMSHVAMTEEEARQYYDKHPTEFMSTPTVTLREILVTTPPAPTGASAVTFGASNDSAAKAKIQAALDRLHAGEDFAAVATDVSESASKAKGGLMAPVNIEDLATVVHDAIDKLKPGELTQPIKTARGYQVFKVEARTTQAVLPFDKVHESIMQKVFDQRSDVETRKYVERLRAQALIEWKDENLKKLYENRATVVK